MSSSFGLDASFVLVNREAEGNPAAPRTPDVFHAETQASRHPSNSHEYVPGSSASFAHDWSSKGTGGNFRIHGRYFIDAFGRVCNPRGVNLGGASKTPTNDNHDLFPADPENVTFVGRPFPLEEAHEHFSRLRRWGFTFIRFLVTWEAIEHAGPGIYDFEYLAYVRKLLSFLPSYGMCAIVEVHQDVWSRYSGGSGAPAWTLEVAGFDLHNLHDSAAAWLLGVKGGGHTEDERGVWPCGYQRLAASTLATLFWAGDTFAAKLRVKGHDGKEVSYQQFLQNAFLDMYDQLVQAVGDLDGVLGFEMMNEPHRGFIDLPSLHSYDYNTDLHLSYVPSAFQSFMLGAGHPTAVPFWSRSFPMPTRLTSHKVLNPKGVKAWSPDGPTKGQCLWEMHGVWGWDKSKGAGVVLRENYFTRHPSTGRKIEWYQDFYFPFLRDWARRVSAGCPRQKLFFVEPIPNEYCPASWTPEWRLPNMVFSPHWYDLNALFAKAFGNFTVNVQGLSRGMSVLRSFYWGQRGARENYALQISNIVQAAHKALGDAPVFVGECGVPMDMNKAQAMETDDWTWQARMMDAVIWALERSIVPFILWNYNPENDDRKGDDWNGENFSWFSRKRALPASLLYYDQDSPSLDNGCRILPVVVRPYPAKVAGVPLRFQYEVTTGRIEFEWTSAHAPSGDATQAPLPHTAGLPPLTSRETEIFLPSALALGRKIIVSGLLFQDNHRYDQARQTLFIVARDSKLGPGRKVTITFDPPPQPIFEVNDFWGDFGSWIIALVMIVLAVIVYPFLA